MSDNLEIKLPVNSDDLVKADERAKKLITTTDKVVTSLNQLQSAVLGKEASTKGVAALRKEILTLGKESGPVSETISKHLGTSLDRLERDAGKYRSIVASLGREAAKPGTFTAEAVKKMHADKTEMLLSMGQTLNSLKLGVQAIRNQTAAGIAEQAAAIAKSVDAAEDAGKRLKTAASSAASALAQENALTQRMIAAEGKITAERGKERLAGIRQDSAATLKQHKQAAAAERSALAQENALTRQMIAAEGKAEAERAKERLAGIRQESATLLAARKDSQKAQEDAIIREFKSLSALVTKGNADLLAARSKAAAGTLRPDIDLNRLEPTPNTLSPAQLYRANAGIQKFRADQAKPLAPAAASPVPKPSEIDGATSSFGKLSRAIWDSHSAVRGLASGFGLLWLTWGSTLPLLAGAIASFSVVKSFKVGTELERSMFEITNLAGLGATEAGKLKDTLLDLGKTSTYTATQAAEAAKILSLAGLKGAEVQAALVPTLRFASSGGVTMERAAEVLTSVGEAYAYSANAYSTVSDIIVKASSDSIASVEDMAEAFKTSSVLAQSYGVSLTDTAFALESLANIGIKGSAAGTSYRNFVTELTRADGKAAAMMKAIGVTALDSTGQLRPLLDITRDLTAATINLSGSEQRKVQDALANERGGKLYAATQAVLSKELKTSQQATLDEAAAMQASGRIKEAQALRVKAVANAYEILSKRQKESVDNAAGLTFFADLEKKVTTGGMFQGVQASLSSQLAKAFEAAQPALNSFAISLRETINSEQFKNDLSAIATTLAELGKAALDAAKWLYEHKGAVLLAGAAYVGLPAVIAAITAGVGFWTGGMVTLTASITAAKVAAVSNFQQIAGVLTGVTSSIGAAGTFAALQATAMTAAVVALGVAAAVAAGTLAAAGVAYLLFGDSAAAATRKVLEAEMKLSKDKAASLEAQIKSTNDGLAAEIEGTKAAIKVKEKGTAAGEIATRVMGAQAIARVNAYWDEIGVLARKNLELEKHNILLKGGDWYQTADAEARYNKQAISDLQDRNRAVSSLEGRISTLVKLKRQEAKLDMEASERNRKHEQGGGKGPDSATNRFAQKLPTPYYDLKEFTSNVAALGKAELDALKNSRTAKLAELKDYHDAGLLSIGNYEAQVISVTEAGYKAEAAKLDQNLARELAELEAHEQKVLTFYGQRSEDIKKQFANDAKGQAEAQERLDDEVIDRLGASHTKQLAATAEFNTSKAKMRQDADDAERNATIKHAKDLMAIRAKVAEAIAASQDRVAGMREEAEVANRTAGLSGPELEAVQARLKVEIDGRKTLRTLDNALTTERQRATDILAVYERETDAETRLIQWQAYVDANEKINTLLDGRSKLEVTLGNEAAEAYALAYDKAFKRIADGIAENLSGGIVDALFTGGKEGAKKLRDTLKKELLMKPFQMVIQAMIQPVARGMANVLTGGMYGKAGSGGLFGGGPGNLLSNIGSGIFGSASSYASGLGLASSAAGSQAAMLAAQTGSFGASGLALTAEAMGTAGTTMASAAGTFASATSALGAAMPYLGAILAVGSLLKGMDDSGTIHTGGLAQYSATGGTQTSTAHGAFGMGFGGVDFGQGGTDLAVNMAKSVVGILDSTATAFGKTAGFTAATAFADDTSKDGAWGGLLIQKLGETVLNWDDTRSSRWAPKEFADGEAGAKEYAAAVAKDVRDLLIEQTPGWADTMLNALGDAPTLEQLATTIGQINEVVAALKFMGQASEAFAGLAESAVGTLVTALGGAQAATAKLGSYYTNFYTEAERTALATTALTAEMAAFGKVMPATRTEFRGMVDAAVAAGDTGLAANLLNVADKFAAVVPAADGAADAIDGVADAMRSAKESLATTRFELENQLLTQAGQGSAVQARTDARNLAALTADLPADLAAQVAAEFAQNTALRDLYTANEVAIASYQRGLEAVAENLQIVEEASKAAGQANLDSARSMVTAAQSGRDALQSFFDMLSDSIASLRGSVASTVAMQAAEANAYIAKASILIRSGATPDQGKLQAAIRAATAGIDQKVYASNAEQDFDRLVLAGKLAELQDGTAGQLTIAEQHLSMAQQAVSLAEAQLSALNSIAANLSSAGGAQSAAAKLAKDQWSSVAGQGVYASSGGAVGVLSDNDVTIYGKDGSKFLGSEAIAYVNNQIASDGAHSVYAAAVQTGISATALDQMMGWAAGTSNNWAKANDLPQFAVGTNYVPHDMIAQIHEGEAIIPKAYNPSAGGFGDTAALEEMVAELVTEVRRLSAISNSGNVYARRTADLLDNVTEGGANMRTVTA